MRNATSFVMSVSDSKWHFNFAKGIDEKLPKKRGKLTESLAHKNSAIRFAGHGTFKIRWTEQLTLCYDHYGFTLTIISIRKFLQPPRENIVGFSHYHFKTFSWVHSKDRKVTFLFMSHLLASKFSYIYHIVLCDVRIHSVHRVGKPRPVDTVRAQPLCPPVPHSWAHGSLLTPNTGNLRDFSSCRNVLGLPWEVLGS